RPRRRLRLLARGSRRDRGVGDASPHREGQTNQGGRLMPTANDNPTRADELTWEAPGVGMWVSGADHVPTSVTPSFMELYGPARAAGRAEMFATYGLPAAGYDAGYVRGHLYDRLVPLIGGDKGATKLPPTPVLRLATRVHPEFRKRSKRMAATFGPTRGWEPEL